jgi:WD40 repeat protein
VSAAYDNCVKIWPIDADLPLATLTDHQDTPHHLLYEADCDWLCTASDSTILLHDLRTLELLRSYSAQTTRRISCVHRDGNLMAYGNNGGLHVCDLRMDAEVGHINVYQGAMLTLRIADAMKIYTGGGDDDPRLVLHDLRRLTPVARRNTKCESPHVSGIFRIIQAKGSATDHLITAAHDNTVKLWQYPQAHHTIRFEGRSVPLRDIKWDGFSLVALAGSVLHIHDFAPSKSTAAAGKRKQRPHWFVV